MRDVLKIQQQENLIVLAGLLIQYLNQTMHQAAKPGIFSENYNKEG